MKNKQIFIKPVSLVLAVILIMFSFSSCEVKPVAPDEKAFSLVMDYAQTTLKKGDKVTYKAILKNNSHEVYTLDHTDKLIYISIVKAEDYKNDKIVSASASSTDIAPHGQVEEFFDFTAVEKGDYILKAYAVFSIDGKDGVKEYSYECNEIKITVK